MLQRTPKCLDFLHLQSLSVQVYYCPKWVTFNLNSSEDYSVRSCHKQGQYDELNGHSNAKLEDKEAIIIYQKALQNGLKPDPSMLVAALKACTTLKDLETGTKIHENVSDSGDDTNIFVATTLVHMYAKCGRMVQAHRVFDEMPRHDLVSWNALIFGYAESGECDSALQLFAHMQAEGFMPNPRTYVAALKACASCAENENGKQVEGKPVKVQSLEKVIAFHSQLAKFRYDSNIFVASAMVDAYCGCGSMEHARLVFDKMPHHNLVSWTAIISGHTEIGKSKLALELFARMQDEGFIPDPQTYLIVLKACASFAAQEYAMEIDGKLVKVQSIEKVKSIHSQLAKRGYEYDIFLSNTLVDVYGKCGSMDHACWSFGKISHHDPVSWTAMIFGYAESGEGDLALQLFFCKQEDGLVANSCTYVAVLKACAICAAKEVGMPVKGKLIKVQSLEQGMSIRSQLAKHGYDLDIFVANTMMDLYAKCGSMVHARQVFDKMAYYNLVSWNAMIFGYADSGESKLALKLFVRMQDEGFMPDDPTYVAALKACAACAAEEYGERVDRKIVKMQSLENVVCIHSQLAKRGYENDIFVASTLVDVYAKCGTMERARWFFDKMEQYTLVSWTAMIFGYVETAESDLALQLFAQMQEEGFLPDALTYVAALKACGNLVALESGKNIHIQICHAGLQNEEVIVASLIGFYGKCGVMVDAERVFDDSMSRKSLVIWNALLAGYARHGDAKRVFSLFTVMQKEHIQADDITFLSILNACSYAGLVGKGKKSFQVMCVHYAITPNLDHYACIVDLLCRANHLNDAAQVVKNMPFDPNLTIWKTVLGACQNWKNEVIGRLAFESVLTLDNKDASAYVLMKNIYTTSDKL